MFRYHPATSVYVRPSGNLGLRGKRGREARRHYRPRWYVVGVELLEHRVKAANGDETSTGASRWPPPPSCKGWLARARLLLGKADNARTWAAAGPTMVAVVRGRITVT
jgi:hypothetical protein